MISNISNLTNAVSVSDGKVTTNSLKISEVFGKKHCDVLRTIESLQVPDDFRKRNFAFSEYSAKSGIGKTVKYTMVNITRDGFTILVMGFTGSKAMQFKIAYLEEFNRMEAKLRELQCGMVQPELPMDCVPAVAGAFSKLRYKGVEVIPTEELRKRLGITTGQLERWLYAYKPMIEGVDAFKVVGVTDKLALQMIRSGYAVAPAAININLYTRSGFAKAAARFAPGAVTEQKEETATLPKPEALPLPLPRLKPGVTPDNFTFKIKWFRCSETLHFSDTAIGRFGRFLLEMGYDPTEMLQEFHTARNAAFCYAAAFTRVQGQREELETFFGAVNDARDIINMAKVQEEFFTFRADGSRLESMDDFNRRLLKEANA